MLLASHHGNVDVGKSEVVHDKVRSDLHCHAGHGQGILPQPCILENVGQTDQRHVLEEGGKEKERGKVR